MSLSSESGDGEAYLDTFTFIIISPVMSESSLFNLFDPIISYFVFFLLF